jgi:hypothetical protein
MNTLEKLKEVTANLKNEELKAVDVDGKTYSLMQASKAGVNVTLINSKISALKEFKDAFGIDLTDPAELNQLQKILQLVGGGSVGETKKKRLTDEEKRDLINNWRETMEAYANKADFCKKNNISYQSFLQWEKQFG